MKISKFNIVFFILLFFFFVEILFCFPTIYYDTSSYLKTGNLTIESQYGFGFFWFLFPLIIIINIISLFFFKKNKFFLFIRIGFILLLIFFEYELDGSDLTKDYPIVILLFFYTYFLFKILEMRSLFLFYFRNEKP
jgi:hypothetical protein